MTPKRYVNCLTLQKLAGPNFGAADSVEQGKISTFTYIRQEVFYDGNSF